MAKWYMDPNNPDAAAYRAANGINANGKKGPIKNQPAPAPTPKTPQQLVNDAAVRSGAWDDRAQGLSDAAIGYGQNNPFSNTASDYQARILGGDISQNPFMTALQGDLNGVNMNESMDYLRQFLGPSSGSGGFGGPTQPVGHVADPNNVQGLGGAHLASATGGAGSVPDTVGGNDSFFAQHIRDLFDPSRLDPAHDPTMAPYLDMLSRKSNEALMGQLADVSARAEGSGMYGGSLYQNIDRNTRLGSQQALTDSQTQALMQARQEALQNQMGGLGLTNTRDIAAMNDATQRYGIDASSAASSAGNAAAAAAQANAQRLQAIGMMLQGGQYGLGIKNDLASTLQGGQNSALNSGIGYGQLGMSGFNTGINAGQLGLAGLGQQGQLGLGQQQVDATNRQINSANSNNRFNQNMALQNMQQGSLNDYLQILMGIGGMGGGSFTSQTNPGTPTAQGMDPWMAALLGGMGAANTGS